MTAVKKYSVNPWENRITGNQPRVRGDLETGNWFPPGDPRNNPDVLDPLTADGGRDRSQIIADNNAHLGEGHWAFHKANGPRPLQGMLPGTDGMIYDGETVGPNGQIIPDSKYASQYLNHVGPLPPSLAPPPQNRPLPNAPGAVADQALGPDGQPLGGRSVPVDPNLLRLYLEHLVRSQSGAMNS
jgi:hypothetical protein